MAATEGNSRLLAAVLGHQRQATWPSGLVHIPCQAMNAPAAPAPVASSCSTLHPLITRCSHTLCQLQEVHMVQPAFRSKHLQFCMSPEVLPKAHHGLFLPVAAVAWRDRPIMLGREGPSSIGEKQNLHAAMLLYPM